MNHYDMSSLVAGSRALRAGQECAGRKEASLRANFHLAAFYSRSAVATRQFLIRGHVVHICPAHRFKNTDKNLSFLSIFFKYTYTDNKHIFWLIILNLYCLLIYIIYIYIIYIHVHRDRDRDGRAKKKCTVLKLKLKAGKAQSVAFGFCFSFAKFV